MFKSTALQTVKAAPKASIYLRSGASYYQPIFAANGKLRPGFATVNGVPQHVRDGIYSLRYQLHGKRKWDPVGADAQLALTKKIQRERILAAQAAGGLVTDQVAEITKPSESTSLEAQLSEYLKEIKDHKSRQTYQHLAIPFCSEAVTFRAWQWGQTILPRVRSIPAPARTSYMDDVESAIIAPFGDRLMSHGEIHGLLVEG